MNRLNKLHNLERRKRQKCCHGLWSCHCQVSWIQKIRLAAPSPARSSFVRFDLCSSSCLSGDTVRFSLVWVHFAVLTVVGSSDELLSPHFPRQNETVFALLPGQVNKSVRDTYIVHFMQKEAEFRASWVVTWSSGIPQWAEAIFSFARFVMDHWSELQSKTEAIRLQRYLHFRVQKLCVQQQGLNHCISFLITSFCLCAFACSSVVRLRSTFEEYAFSSRFWSRHRTCRWSDSVLCLSSLLMTLSLHCCLAAAYEKNNGVVVAVSGVAPYPVGSVDSYYAVAAAASFAIGFGAAGSPSSCVGVGTPAFALTWIEENDAELTDFQSLLFFSHFSLTVFFFNLSAALFTCNFWISTFAHAACCCCEFLFCLSFCYPFCLTFFPYIFYCFSVVFCVASWIWWPSFWMCRVCHNRKQNRSKMKKKKKKKKKKRKQNKDWMLTVLLMLLRSLLLPLFLFLLLFPLLQSLILFLLLLMLLLLLPFIH